MKKVLVGMSGGVDSAVTAALLNKEGYHVSGVTLKLWRESGSADEDAANVAAQIGIPHKTIDYSKRFYDTVVNYFTDEYKRGRTPNPCVVCNRELKLAALSEIAEKEGIPYIATGHYAVTEKKDGKVFLYRGKNRNKDQSYFLYDITRSQLEKLIFPLGIYSKDEVREIAEKMNIKIAKKPDSQEICFLPDGKYGEFIARYAKELPPEGNIVDKYGNILGRHNGIYNYTIGQRKGLGSFGRPVFVTKINVADNTICIGDDEYSDTVRIRKFHATGDYEPIFPIKATAKIRYRAKEAECVATQCEEYVEIKFSSPQRAVTPGQSVVLYSGEMVLGGGVIEAT